MAHGRRCLRRGQKKARHDADAGNITVMSEANVCVEQMMSAFKGLLLKKIQKFTFGSEDPLTSITHAAMQLFAAQH